MASKRPTQSTVTSALLEAAALFADAGIESGRLDAQLLLAKAIGGRREDLIREPTRVLTADELSAFAALRDHRANRTPLAYLLGVQWFYGLDFEVNEAVLIPRPETEMLVAFVLEHAPQHAAIADIGTGSGCIAISIAAERPGLTIEATDISPDAIDVALRNADRHDLAKSVTFHLGDLLSPLAGKAFDVIVSNPPYIAPSEMAALMPEVRDFEPRTALCEGAGDDGIAFYRRLFADARAHLKPEGRIAVEVGLGQASLVAQIAAANGYADIAADIDFGDIERVISAVWPG